jgi:adenine-specific DNA-methyltransferase
VKSYAGQVKCIYIDPPYNTGSDGFVYNDKFKFTAEDLEKKLSISPDEAEKIIAMTSGHRASHAAWLTFMMPRLQLARELLSKDGVIFISIDDNEQAYLKQLCDNVFGEDDFVGTIIWNNATDNNPTNLTIEHEYILCYTRNKELLEPIWKSSFSAIKDLLIEKGKELNGKYKGEQLQTMWKQWYKENKNQLGELDRYKYIDEGGVYTGSQSVHNPGKEGYRYDIIHPVTQKPCKQPLMGYRFPEASMQKMIDEGRILFGDDETKLVEIKLYASEYQDKFSSVYELDSRAGANELKTLFPEAKQIFKNPKPTEVIEHILSYMNTGDLYVMDFFGGSSTTADAIM